MLISAIVLTKNEEKNIENCLQHLSWCNEIIVVDDNSTDRTMSLVKKYKAKVYSHALANDFAAQRNFGLEKAQGEWVLFVDADEVVSENLKKEILRFAQNDNDLQGFYIKRQDYMWRKELQHGEQGNMKLLRLAKKNSGHWEGKVHEVWKIKGKTEQLENPLLHYPHQSIQEFLQEINFYSTLRAQELYDNGVRVNWLSILFYPKAKFVQNYFLKLGFLDGIEGFLVAILMSLHAFLVRGKLWQRNNA